MPETLEPTATKLAEITRLTVLLYEYADDTERFSWLATTPEELTTLRAALKTLGLHATEDKVPATERLFSDLFCADGRTVHSARTSAEIIADFADEAANETDRKIVAEITEFLANAELDEDMTGEYQGCEYSITCIYTPETGVLPRYSP